jgi:hypothetical protein
VAVAVPHQQTSNWQEKKNLVLIPRCVLAPRQNGQLTVGRNIISTLTWESAVLFSRSKWAVSRELSSMEKQKFTAGNQPARSFLASSPAGTHCHRSVQCQYFVFFPLFLPIVKGGVGLFLLYRLVFTYHTLFHLRLHSFLPLRGLQWSSVKTAVVRYSSDSKVSPWKLKNLHC